MSQTENMDMIPTEAVEAALAASLAYKSQRGMDNAENKMRSILAAAAPHMLAEVQYVASDDAA